MTGFRLAADQVVLEQKRFWRNPASAVFTFMFPLLFLVIFGSLNFDNRLSSLGDIDFNQFFTPNIVAFGVMSACWVDLGINLTFRRDAGLLKRIRGTPMPPWAFMVAVVANAFFVSALLTVIVVAFGEIAYNVSFSATRIPELVLVLLVGASAFSAIGIAIASVVPNADAAPAIINAVYFPLVFLSGTFFPVSSDSVLGRIAAIFPVRPFLQATFATFDPFRSGSRVSWSDLAVVAAWGVAAAVFALRNFRWEPRTK